MQQGDFGSSYYPYPQSNPTPIDHQQPPPAPPSAAPSYASAPPFSSTGYGTSDYTPYPHNYPPFPHNSDPLPTAPSPYPQPPPPQQPPVSHYVPPPPGPESQGFYPPQSAQQQPPPPVHYPPYDPPQPALNYPPPPSNSYPGPDSSSNTSLYPSNFINAGSSGPSPYESPYGSGQKLDHGSGSGYFDDSLGRYSDYGASGVSKYGDYGRSRSDLGSDIYGKRPESGGGGGGGLYGSGLYADGGGDDGVYAYKGKSDPYGARGTAPKSSTWAGTFDDYGRAISSPKEREKSSPLKVVRAVPKAETQSDMKSGVQKFRVKLLPESGNQDVMDVLFQVGLDGIRMLDPSTSRTLRIYPLETVTRCDKIESSTFAFWAKTSVDIDPRRIRLQSNSYTTNTLLDTVTAAIVQFKEMGGRSMPPQSSTIPAQPVEKKKGLTDWIVKLKPVNEEKDHWMPDEAVAKCTSCGTDFSAFVRRHHCRNCGDIFCDKCTQGRTALTADESAPTVRVCDRCMAEVTRRLSNASKETATRSTGLQSHEDLAKKLQDEMERNRRSSSGSKSEGSGRRMREVACPTCTVHLQVQVPSSGSETIECGVCQHPFLVSAH